MRPPLVLVVDDVVAIVEELLTLMRLHKIPAAGALDLNGAIQTLVREPDIRLISCDVRLDRGSGPDIIGLIKRHSALRHRDLQFLFVTGDPVVLEQNKDGDRLLMLSKPVQPTTLISTIKNMLGVEHA